ncbi:MAG TPA: hypothetical protein VKB50_06925 [Vicinamibacterales bacterium]|nr:hypothetical protein [Vicinamibacterales bacterium]
MSLTIACALLLGVSLASAAAAQSATEANVREFFNGQQMLVTYREGGPVYGTFFTLQVHFCRSGRYITFGESRKHTVLDNEQVNRFTDQGTWTIGSLQGRMILKYVSISGQPNIVAVNVTPNGRVSLGDGGISVVRQGPAQCPR